MRITRLRLQDIRGFAELTIEFDKARIHTVLIGKNGTCKTTILRAIAIGLADSKDASGLLAESNGVLVAEGKTTATIEVDVTSEDDPNKTITTKTKIGMDDGQDVLLDKEPEHETPGNVLVCGYGIARQTEGSSLVRPYRIIDSVYTMFVYDAALVGTELTLRRLRDYLGTRQFPRTLRGIKRALGLSARDRIRLPKGGGVVISGPSIGKAIPIEGWADGYRKTLSWILDLYAWAMRARRVTKAGGIRGILLVDEVEQHLHPSIQTALLARLRDLFPELQVIATTHSLLVALGAEPQSVVVLKRDGKRVVRESSVPNFTMYSVEDMLADPEIFDSAVYRPETNAKLARYRNLSAKSPQDRTAKEKAELETLAEELSAQQIPEVHESPAIKKLNQLLQKHNL
jgi:predicted ATP-binding protein involved in virulence